ncbi:MAG TPA: hypothetical protein VGM52_03135 [Herbaspirillum sp.]
MTSRLPGLIAGFAEDKENVGKAIEIVDQTCKKILDGIDEKMRLKNEEQAQRQGATEDLLLIGNSLGNYKNEHPGQKGAIDLSSIVVTLSSASPLFEEGGKTMPLADLIAYYKKEHPELALPQVPTTVRMLDYFRGQIDTAIRISLEPASQRAFIHLQECVQEKRAMTEMQSMMYHIIFAAFEKFVSGM